MDLHGVAAPEEGFAKKTLCRKISLRRKISTNTTSIRYNDAVCGVRGQLARAQQGVALEPVTAGTRSGELRCFC